MAFWVVSDGADVPLHDEYFVPKRKTASHHDLRSEALSKRARLEDWSPSSISKIPAFLVIREGTPPSNHHHHHHNNHDHDHDHKHHQDHHPPSQQHLAPPTLERTQSGLSISSQSSDLLLHEPSTPGQLTDLAAAHLVRSHIQSTHRDSQPARILRSLINPRLRHAKSTPLDDTALHSLFHAANALFFANRLSRRVVWDWSSSPSSSHYAAHVIGTTALRRCSVLGGWETLIVLSTPILRDVRYSRRLLIATFLHEMIHSFLFVVCGPGAARSGGHTEGFRTIAELIDQWVGRENLRLADVEADLERFRDDETVPL